MALGRLRSSRNSRPIVSEAATLWLNLRAEAELLAAQESSLRPWIEALVLRHESMHRSDVALVAEALATDHAPIEGVADQLSNFAVMQESVLSLDLGEARSRDQAATDYSTVFLF